MSLSVCRDICLSVSIRLYSEKLCSNRQRDHKRDIKLHPSIHPWASYQIRKIASCACAGNAGFPHGPLQRKPLVSDPGMHHGTCVTHVPWCMSGSLTRGDGENVPVIPCACALAILRIWQAAHSLGNVQICFKRFFDPLLRHSWTLFCLVLFWFVIVYFLFDVIYFVILTPLETGARVWQVQPVPVN